MRVRERVGAFQRGELDADDLMAGEDEDDDDDGDETEPEG